MSENTETNNNYSLANKIKAYAAGAALTLGLAGCGTPQYARDLDSHLDLIQVTAAGTDVEDRKELTELHKLIGNDMESFYLNSDKEQLRQNWKQYRESFDDEWTVNLPEGLNLDRHVSGRDSDYKVTIDKLTHKLSDTGVITESTLNMTLDGHYLRNEGTEEQPKYRRINHTYAVTIVADNDKAIITYRFDSEDTDPLVVELTRGLSSEETNDDYRTEQLLNEGITARVRDFEDLNSYQGLITLLKKVHPALEQFTNEYLEQSLEGTYVDLREADKPEEPPEAPPVDEPPEEPPEEPPAEPPKDDDKEDGDGLMPPRDD